MYNKQQDMYIYIVKDIHGQWFKSKLFFITKQEANEEAAEIAEYEFVDTVKVLEEDDDEYLRFNKKTKLN